MLTDTKIYPPSVLPSDAALDVATLQYASCLSNNIAIHAASKSANLYTIQHGVGPSIVKLPSISLAAGRRIVSTLGWHIPLQGRSVQVAFICVTDATSPKPLAVDAVVHDCYHFYFPSNTESAVTDSQTLASQEVLVEYDATPYWRVLNIEVPKTVPIGRWVGVSLIVDPRYLQAADSKYFWLFAASVAMYNN